MSIVRFMGSLYDEQDSLSKDLRGCQGTSQGKRILILA